ncbi:VanW family protein [Qiania dongpingensis]|uniref:VanW family protein n=1 Tax=Qiania dongpingensis TaxID=2763669 RepID=A0A7G9G5V3_9FIRM|nr:VanW family protein [Qiania dongpingensis]QNM06185.1 VanW family protein [Qiania dongpingensis]
MKITDKEQTHDKKKKSLWERAPMLCMVLAALGIVALVIGIFIVKKSVEHNQILSHSETFYEGIFVENIPLDGLTMDQAREKVAAAVEGRYTWAVKVDCGGESYDVDNILTHNTDEILAEAFRLGHEGSDEERLSDITLLKRKAKYYTVSDSYEETKLEKAVANVAARYDVAAKNAALTGYDEEDGFQYSAEESGRQVDQEDLKTKLRAALDVQDYDAALAGKVSEVIPELNLEQAKEAYTCIAKFRTEANVNSEDRDHNVKLASDTINNTVLAPGEEFSMNALVGETNESQGYRQAATYAQGQVVPEFGGGVCQVSSTIYNAVVKSGLKTTERNSHSMTVSYVNLGEDAMIAYSYSDLKFVNNSSGNVLVLVDADGAEVTCYIYGIPVLEEGVSVMMDSKIEETLPIPEPEYVEDDTLAPGEEKYKSWGKEGYRVVTDLVVMKDGVEISREFLHNSTYNPQTPIIRRNSGS